MTNNVARHLVYIFDFLLFLNKFHGSISAVSLLSVEVGEFAAQNKFYKALVLTISIYLKQITGSEGGGGWGRGWGVGLGGGRFLVLGLVGQVDFPVGCIHHNILLLSLFASDIPYVQLIF